MRAFCLGRIEIKDRKAYRAYAEQFLPVLHKYEGELIGLSDQIIDLEGSWGAPRAVVISFESKEKAERWYRSPEYAKLIALRQAAAVSDIVLFESMV